MRLWVFCSPEHSTGKNQRLGFDHQSGFAPDPDSDHRDGLASGAFQPNYPPVVQWRQALQGSNKVVKKKAAVAVAPRPVIETFEMTTRPNPTHQDARTVFRPSKIRLYRGGV